MDESKPQMPATPNREEALFQAASQLTGAERAIFLNGACLGDDALRQRLEALLAAHDAPDEISPTNKPDAVATMKVELADAPDEAVGQTLGRYKLLERVGEGGCGVVYVAEQTEPVRRRVALKVIKLGMDTKQVVARFEAERQALAMMDHPNIAKVLDAGTTDTGRPYFVMELVRGIRITDYCDQNKLPTKERLDLFIKVCQAIQHAHQKGIIHRDIKPSNILVTLHDGVPVPKVIDFGIAKATEGRLTDATVYTQLHQFIGTPAYMSPEQAEMSGLDIDTRSDIYSLGVLLYELLAGSTPFDGQELMSQGIDAMRKTIREKEPPRPSTRFATLEGEELTTTAKRRSADKAKLVHQLKGDLDWIVMKCLEKDRTRRYETANGLAVDLKRHLNNETVAARPPSAAYKFQKAFRRNKLAFAAAGAVAVALLLGIIGTSLGLVRAERQRQEAEAARKLAEQRFLSASHFVEDMFQQVAPKFRDLIGTTEAQQALAQISVNFLESLGGTNGGGQAYESELAELDAELAYALGNEFIPNTVGDYSNALRFASQALTIEQNLVKTRPNDGQLLRQMAQTEDQVGGILQMLNRPTDSIDHFKRRLELLQQLLNQNPGDTNLEFKVRTAHFRIGNVLMDQGRAKEALEQYYLPYAKQLLDHPLDPTLDSSDAHMCYVAHGNVGDAEMQLDQPSNALTQFEEALQWKKMLVDREPDDARHARDWSEIHSDIGTAQIALGRFDEGLTNLDEAVRLAEPLVEGDPSNGSAQELLADALQDAAKGYATVAGSSGISRTRQAALWQQAIAALTSCQEKLDSPQLAHMPQWRLTQKRNDVSRALSEARNAYAKIAGETRTDSSNK
jgi:tetratricopeptide (TPR) repeat protein/tRNA A-37 threonylcarbamoyl transferase component Bud32